MADIALPQWAEMYRQPSRYKAVYGGRGSSKSQSAKMALILRAAERPTRILCCREIQRSIRDSVKRLLDDMIDRAGFRSFFTSTDNEIRGANGSLFMFAGLRSNIASIKSMEGIDIADIEEAQSVSRASLETLIPTIRKDGSEIWASWNPEDAKDPIDELFRGPNGPPPDSIVRQVNYMDNPWFPAVLRKEMEWDRDRDPEKYAHVWLGEYRRLSEARVFKNWKVEDFDTPNDAMFKFGADWGYAVDPSVLVRCWLDDRTLYIDNEAYEVGCSIDDTPALFSGDDTRDPPRWENTGYRKGIVGANRWPIIADSARPETIAYMKARGFDIKPANKGPGSVEDGVEFLRSVDIRVHPRCRHVVDELTRYAYKVDPHTGFVLPVLADKNNHTIDALRYALEGARKAIGNIASVSSNTRETVDMWAGSQPQQTGGMW